MLREGRDIFLRPMLRGWGVQTPKADKAMQRRRKQGMQRRNQSFAPRRSETEMLPSLAELLEQECPPAFIPGEMELAGNRRFANKEASRHEQVFELAHAQGIEGMRS